MYMVTRGSSGTPLIKLSEGYSFGLKRNYVTIVCGSNGERLKPIKVWDKPFVFFGKEKLNAEFISKSELVYVRVSDKDNSELLTVEIIKYKLPDYVINNVELEYETLRKIKPITETLFRMEIEKDIPIEYSETIKEMVDNAIDSVANGNFKEAVIQALNKVSSKDMLCYAL